MLLIFFVPAVILIVGASISISKRKGAPFGFSIFLAIFAIALTANVVQSIGEGLPARYVLLQDDVYSLAQVDGEYATATIENGEVIIQFTYADENGRLYPVRASVADVIVLVDPDAEPIVEIFKNRNGTWYALDEGSLQYWITIPQDTFRIAIPTVN